ncbi:MAG: peptidase S16 [Betaproteobacteria bacterium]|nr:MAG: peptidase S16 [Betaproteobacteria bacterium]
MFSFFGKKQDAATERAETLSLFPLSTTVFPGGRLSLKVFEQRYYELAKRCITSGEPFGVVTLSAGNEGSHEQSFAKVGTSVSVSSFDAPAPNIFVLDVVGQQRFEITATKKSENGLHKARVRWIDAEPEIALPPEYAQLAELLKPIVEGVGEARFAPPFRLDDATWVGSRWTEILRVPPAIKQALLEINDPLLRLKTISQLIARGQGDAAASAH